MDQHTCPQCGQPDCDCSSIGATESHVSTDSGYASQALTSSSTKDKARMRPIAATGDERIVHYGKSFFGPKQKILKHFKGIDVSEQEFTRFTDLQDLLCRKIAEYGRREGVLLKPFYMTLVHLGPDLSEARPCILVTCSKTVLKPVTSFFAQKWVKEQLEPPPFDGFPTFKLYVAAVPSRALTGNVVKVFQNKADVESLQGLNGRRIFVKHADTWATSTIGGVIHVTWEDGKTFRFALTAGHLFSPWHSDDQTLSSQSESSEDNSLSVIFIEDSFQEQHETSPASSLDDEASISLCDILEPAEIGLESAHTYQVPIPTPKPHSSPPAAQESDLSVLGIYWETSNLLSETLDYAIVNITDEVLCHNDQVYSLPRDDSSSRSVYDRRRVAFRCQGVVEKTGYLSLSAAVLILGESTEPIVGHKLELDDGFSFTEGDSGAWVFEYNTGILHGYVTSVDLFGDGEVMPMRAAFADMESRLGAKTVKIAGTRNDSANIGESRPLTSLSVVKKQAKSAKKDAETTEQPPETDHKTKASSIPPDSDGISIRLKTPKRDERATMQSDSSDVDPRDVEIMVQRGQTLIIHNSSSSVSRVPQAQDQRSSRSSQSSSVGGDSGYGSLYAPSVKSRPVSDRNSISSEERMSEPYPRTTNTPPYSLRNPRLHDYQSLTAGQRYQSTTSLPLVPLRARSSRPYSQEYSSHWNTSYAPPQLYSAPMSFPAAPYPGFPPPLQVPSYPTYSSAYAPYSPMPPPPLQPYSDDIAYSRRGVGEINSTEVAPRRTSADTEWDSISAYNRAGSMDEPVINVDEVQRKVIQEGTHARKHRTAVTEQHGADAIFPPIRLFDSLGRVVLLPWTLCRTWKGMESEIRRFSLSADTYEQVRDRQYDLIGPDNQLINPSAWESTVRPGWSITMRISPTTHPSNRQGRGRSYYRTLSGDDGPWIFRPSSIGPPLPPSILRPQSVVVQSRAAMPHQTGYHTNRPGTDMIVESSRWGSRRARSRSRSRPRPTPRVQLYRRRSRAGSDDVRKTTHRTGYHTDRPEADIMVEARRKVTRRSRSRSRRSRSRSLQSRSRSRSRTRPAPRVKVYQRGVRAGSDIKRTGRRKSTEAQPKRPVIEPINLADAVLGSLDQDKS